MCDLLFCMSIKLRLDVLLVMKCTDCFFLVAAVTVIIITFTVWFIKYKFSVLKKSGAK